jgi:hypothetical protein
MKNTFLTWVLTISLAIAAGLIAATHRINFWPTDSELAYIPAATQVFSTPFISDLHHATLFNYNIMHGKETLVVAIAVAQRILNDYESLFPNILVLILTAAGSGILIFLILREWLDEKSAWLGFLFFATTFWTYQYVLQGAHQPLVMFNCLLTAFFLLECDGRRRGYFFAGLTLGLMLFSSPTAAVYGPYLIAAYFHTQHRLQPRASLIAQLKPSVWIVLGAAVIILIFTLPDPAANWRAFMAFVRDCQHGNHFQVVERFTGQHLPKRGAGVIWIFRYFCLIMPVLFGAYAVALLYLVVEGIKKPAFVLWAVVILSLSTPIGVEIIGVAQFGRNYFSWLPGILLACAYALHYFERLPSTLPAHRRLWSILVAVIFAGHLAFNAWAFLGDVLPSRMATTYLYDWLSAHPGEKFAYRLHPHNVNTVNVLNHPNTKNPVRFQRIDSIRQVKDGYILVPMESGKSIYTNCATPDFYDDAELTKLMDSGEFDRYVAASFPTMVSSQFWPQEEEYCSYLDLVQGKITDRDRRRGYVWVLDAGKLQREWFKK